MISRGPQRAATWKAWAFRSESNLLKNLSSISLYGLNAGVSKTKQSRLKASR
jgi:hypothetical protein